MFERLKQRRLENKKGIGYLNRCLQAEAYEARGWLERAAELYQELSLMEIDPAKSTLYLGSAANLHLRAENYQTAIDLADKILETRILDPVRTDAIERLKKLAELKSK